MTRLSADEAMRDAFQALADRADRPCSDEDLEQIWRAVSGELPATERRELVDRISTDHACAEAWRVADQLWQTAQGDAISSDESHIRWWAPTWLATAAILILGVGIAVLSVLNPRQANEFREPGSYAVASLVPSDTSLSRETFQLRWTPGPQGSRYQVRVTTEDLQVLTTVDDLAEPQLVVPSERLMGLSAGARVLWQVDVVLPTGERVSSQTFVTRVQ